MKKILQLLILVLLANVSYGQLLFEIDFEDGTLGDMTIVDNDGLTPASPVSGYTDAWNVRAGINDITSGVAISNSWYSSPAAADDWLITPQLAIADAATAISWEAVAIDPNFADGYEVRISTTDNDIASFTTVLWSTPGEQASGQLEKRIASLGDFVGENIYIAFRNNSFDKFLLAIDNISVRVIQARDVTVNGFTGAKYHVKNTEIPVTVNITNNGGELLESVDLHWSDGANEYMNTLTGLSLATGESMDVTSTTPFMAVDAVSYNLTIWAANPNGDTDLAEGDNLIDASVAGVSYVPNRKVVVEEGTGTWCGWCPRGTVGLYEAAMMFPDNFVGIAVHNGDPMTVSNYDGPLGISGFPGGKVNRTTDSDPGLAALEELIPVMREVISPMAPVVVAHGDEDTRMISISTETEFVTQLDGIDFRLAAVIIEDGVTGTGNGYNQANYYSGGAQGPMGGYENLADPVPASDMVYDHVARVILGGFDGAAGSVPTSVVDGDMASYDFSYEVPADYDMTKMHAVVLVIDNATGEILNSDETEVSLILGTNEIVDESISRVYPNPVSGLAYVDINLRESSEVNLQVIDLMGKTVSNQYLGTLYGNNKMTYDVSNLDAGMYLFRVTAGDLVSTKKITVIK
jgi:hypothetical protein